MTKSKEAALIEAERTIDAAEAKASQVDDLLNRNQELAKQIEICQVHTHQHPSSEIFNLVNYSFAYCAGWSFVSSTLVQEL